MLIVIKNGYTSATGRQFLPSSKASRSGEGQTADIEKTLRGIGVKWMRKVATTRSPSDVEP